MPEGSITRKKKVYYYLPYLHVLCFAAELAGLGVWDSNSRAALDSMRKCLKQLGISANLNTALVWGHGTMAITTTFVVLFALVMLGLGIGRAVIAFQADRTGATRMGGRLMAWMWMDATFVLVFFVFFLWLLLLLLGQCLWMAAAWSLMAAMKVGSKAAIYATGLGLGNTTITYAAEQASDCSLSCVDLAVFQWALGNSTCFCNLSGVQAADTLMKDAMQPMKGSVIGAAMMLLSAVWVLMTAAAEFGVTRRERQLLRRIAKARLTATGEAAKLLSSGNNSGGIGGFGKGKKKSKESLTQPQEAVIIDQETGEVLDVEMTGRASNSAGAGSGNGRGAGGGGGGGGAGSSSGSGGSLKGFTRGMTKGFAKAGKVFDIMGAVLAPRLK